FHPGLQRFISEDPVGFDGGNSNLYTYVGNRPTGSTDPMGLFVLPSATPTLDVLAAVLAGRKSIDENTSPLILSFAGAQVVIASGVVLASVVAFKLYQDWYFERGICAKASKKSAKESSSEKPG